MTSALLERTATEAPSNWRSLMRWAAIATIVGYVIVMTLVEKSPIPPVIIAVAVLLVGVMRMRGDRSTGVRWTTTGLVLSLLIVLVFALPNLFVPASLPSFAITWTVFFSTVVGLIAAVARWRARAEGTAVVRVGLVGAALAAVAVLIGVVASVGYTDAKPAVGDIVVKAKDNSFVPGKLTASHGQVSFFLDNADNTLHEFQITGATGEKILPAKHKVRVTVTLNAGTYEYHCDFHDGMTGTLTVS